MKVFFVHGFGHADLDTLIISHAERSPINGNLPVFRPIQSTKDQRMMRFFNSTITTRYLRLCTSSVSGSAAVLSTKIHSILLGRKPV
jgi:hypothetical protein